MKRARGSIAAIMLAGGLIAAVFALPAGSQTPPAHVRYEKARTFSPRWRAHSGSDFQTRVILFQDDVTTPASADRVDVVVTATLDLRTSRGDEGDVRMGLTRAGTSGAGAPRLRPGRFPCASPSPAADTTCTFTWIAKKVEGAGASYTFQLETGVHDGSDRGTSARSSGSKMTVVIDILPAD